MWILGATSPSTPGAEGHRGQCGGVRGQPKQGADVRGPKSMDRASKKQDLGVSLGAVASRESEETDMGSKQGRGGNRLGVHANAKIYFSVAPTFNALHSCLLLHNYYYRISALRLVYTYVWICAYIICTNPDII